MAQNKYCYYKWEDGSMGQSQTKIQMGRHWVVQPHAWDLGSAVSGSLSSSSFCLQHTWPLSWAVFHAVCAHFHGR